MIATVDSSNFLHALFPNGHRGLKKAVSEAGCVYTIVSPVVPYYKETGNFYRELMTNESLVIVNATLAAAFQIQLSPSPS